MTETAKTAKITETATRRRRGEPGDPAHGMTALKGRVLWHVARCGFLTTSQAARIAGMGKSGAYKHLRDLKDHRLVDMFAPPYEDLRPPGTPARKIAGGAGEDVFYPTRAGIRWLVEQNFLGEAALTERRTIPAPGLFLAHEVLVRDVRIWLELCVQVDGGEIVHWVDGEAAHFSMVRPDAWFLYKLPSGKVLLAMVEADRKTERGDRWTAKADMYTKLIGSPELAEKTGGRTSARIVVVTLDDSRRQRIIHDISGSPVAPGVYCASVADIAEGGLSRPVWQHAGALGLLPLVPALALQERAAETPLLPTLL